MDLWDHRFFLAHWLSIPVWKIWKPLLCANSKVITPVVGQAAVTSIGVASPVVGSWISTFCVISLTDTNLSEIISSPIWVKRIMAIIGTRIANPKAKATYFNSFLKENSVKNNFGFIHS